MRLSLANTASCLNTRETHSGPGLDPRMSHFLADITPLLADVSLVFRERGDVWRFMRSIGQATEGRVWRKGDALKVKLLLKLIAKTTGKFLFLVY